MGSFALSVQYDNLFHVCAEIHERIESFMGSLYSNRLFREVYGRFQSRNFSFMMMCRQSCKTLFAQ